jgi:hypothetical protein
MAIFCAQIKQAYLNNCKNGRYRHGIEEGLNIELFLKTIVRDIYA